MSAKKGAGHGGHARRGGHEEEHEEHENHERWLLTYADMITLLMVLFIVMFAISQVDAQKFMALKTGLASGFGAPVTMVDGGDKLLDPGGAVAPDSVNLAGSAGKQNGHQRDYARQLDVQKVAELAKATSAAAVSKEVAKLKQTQKELKAALRKAGLPKAATFRFDERGLVVTIATDDVLFDSGSATLKPEGTHILATLAPTLRKVPNRLSIDGHTNAIPIATERYPSNWELSADRATGVLRYLAGPQQIPPTRMLATGHADTAPLLPASDPRALAKNRRVEIVVLASVDGSLGKAVAELGNSTDEGEKASSSHSAHVVAPSADTSTSTSASTSTASAPGSGEAASDGNEDR